MFMEGGNGTVGEERYFEGILQWVFFFVFSGDPGSSPGLGISSGEGNGNAIQYSFLENFMDRGAWQSTVHRVAKSWTQLSD